MAEEDRIKQRVEDALHSVRAKVQRRQRLLITADCDALASLLLFLKSEGFTRLSAISCVDWIEDEELELTYHVASDESGIHAMAQVRVPREKPTFMSVASIFEHAQTYEREIWEMFGIVFEGNERLVPLFLDRWQNTPPMRKDFDTRQYVEDTYEAVEPPESAE